MNVEAGIWNRLTTVIIILLIMAGAIAVGIWYLPLIKKNQSLRARVLEIERDLRREEEESRRLKTAIDAVSKDPRTIERLARERLGYARAGETVFRFDFSSTNRPAQRPPLPLQQPLILQ